MPRKSSGPVAGPRLDSGPVPIGRAVSCTIIAISPDADDHSSLAQLCSQSGWKLLSAHSGQQALKMIRSTRVDVAICERDLPDGNWRIVFEELAQFPAAPLVIVVSRLADETLWAEVLNVGGYDVLLKPFEPKEVVWSLTSACLHRESQGRATSSVDPCPPAA